MICVSSKLSSRLILSHLSIDLVVIETMSSPSIIFCCVYVPPRCSDAYVHNTLQTLECLAQQHQNLIVVGDLNSPDICWSSLHGCTPFSVALCDLVFKYNLMQLIDSPTHNQGNTLDILLTNIEHLIQNVIIKEKYSHLCSDHYFVTFHVLVAYTPYHQSKARYILNYNRTDFDGLNEYLFDVDFSNCFTSPNIDIVWQNLKCTILTAATLFTPKTKVNTHLPPKWFTPQIRHYLHKIHTLRRKTRSNSSPCLISKLREMEASLSTMMLEAKTQFEKELITDSSRHHQKLFRYLRHITKSSQIPEHIYRNDTWADTPIARANLFNKHFHSVYLSREANVFDDFNFSPSYLPQLHHINIEEDEVLDLLSSLDLSKSMGMDSIGPKLLKACSVSLYAHITRLFRRCLSKASIPNEWKLHRIIPILKKGDKANVANYRPISLLCSISKVLESIVFLHISEHFLPSLSTYQFGFTQGRSTLQQLLFTLALIYHNSRFHIPTDSIYLDLTKAFDCVPHDKLLTKLWSAGVAGTLWRWVKCYLTGRSQLVSIDNTNSDILPVTSGVPQGSILGPLLFLIYVNDLSTYISNSTILQFADDCKCLSGMHSLQDSQYAR